MTFSLLARDPDTGDLGGIAATGNLCVGAWVLRGDATAGLTASQGRMPSTLWGEKALELMKQGLSAEETVARVIRGDRGRATRQLAVMTRRGKAAAFDGEDNEPFIGHLVGENWIVCGNWLKGPEVIERTGEIFAGLGGRFENRLLAALRAGTEAGSDSRGTESAALLVVGMDRPPLSLRVDWDDDPVGRLEALHSRTLDPAYAEWAAGLPTRTRPDAS